MKLIPRTFIIPILFLSIFISSCASFKRNRALKILSQSSDKLLSNVLSSPYEKKIFHYYNSRKQSTYKQGYWFSSYNLSGIAWDHSKAGVLVSPRHVLYAQHYQRRIGDRLVFHDKNGNQHIRTLIKKADIPGKLDPDITVGLLNREVPIQYYRVLPPRSNWNELLTNKLVISTDFYRQVQLRKISGTAWRRILYKKAHERALDYYYEKLVKGDSGHPSFISINGELVLLSTHTFGGKGAGPFFSEPKNFTAVNLAMKKLDSKYQLTTCPLPDF